MKYYLSLMKIEILSVSHEDGNTTASHGNESSRDSSKNRNTVASNENKDAARDS